MFFWYFGVLSGVAEVVIPQLRDICIEANQKIREVMNSPESKGRDVVWAGIAMDSLVKHSDLLINNKKVLQ